MKTKTPLNPKKSWANPAFLQNMKVGEAMKLSSKFRKFVERICIEEQKNPEVLRYFIKHGMVKSKKDFNLKGRRTAKFSILSQNLNNGKTYDEVRKEFIINKIKIFKMMYPLERRRDIINRIREDFEKTNDYFISHDNFYSYYNELMDKGLIPKDLPKSGKSKKQKGKVQCQ